MGWRGCMSRQESDSRERESVCRGDLGSYCCRCMGYDSLTGDDCG